MTTRLLIVMGMAVVGGWLTSFPTVAAPIQSGVQAQGGQRVLLQVRKQKPEEKSFLPQPLSARILRGKVQWEYIPDTFTSIPIMAFQLVGIPLNQKLSVLIDRTGKLVPDAKQGYVLRAPLMGTESSYRITIISKDGQVEEWEMRVRIQMTRSAVYVDESCEAYQIKISEVQKSQVPNLLYVGCRPGSIFGEMALEVLWQQVDRLVFRSKEQGSQGALFSIPFGRKEKVREQIIGIHGRGERSIFSIDYDPEQRLPFEVYGGISFYRTGFSQAGLDSTYTGMGTALLAKFWFRPDDIPASFMIRGFGTLLNIAQGMTPPTGSEENVATYFLSAELHWRVLTAGSWRISPLVGGWIHFMEVRSRAFGLQRVIAPDMGLTIQKDFGPRNTVTLAGRFVPLAPPSFSLAESYIEGELTWVHQLRRAGKFFVSAYFGVIQYAPPEVAANQGTYLVLGGGWGW